MKMLLGLVFVILVNVVPVEATWQMPDILIHNGVEYPIYVELLEGYFQKFPDRKPAIETRCSALWRGYVATFEFKNGTMVLRDVTADNCNTPKPAMKTVIPDGRTLVIDWFTGLLLSMHGTNDGDSYSLEFLDTFEKYSIFEIDGGQLRKEKHFSNPEYQKFKKRQFAAFKKTADYKEAVRVITADGKRTSENADTIIAGWVFSYTKKFLTD